MSQILVSTSLLLHSLATVVFIGQQILLAVLYVPALSKRGAEGAESLATISKGSRPWMYISLLVFAVTGIYLTLVDPAYMGLGNFSSPWALLMLVKHILVVVMLGLGFWFNGIKRVGPALHANPGEQSLRRFRVYANSMAVAGVAILLLTAIAQVI
jgi:uncharacterized membrane protein